MTPLRQRMLEDIQIRNFSQNTQERALLEERTQAMRDKAAEAAARPLADGVVNYDLAPPLAQRQDDRVRPARVVRELGR